MPRPKKIQIVREEIQDANSDENFGTDEHMITPEEAKQYGVIIEKEDTSD